MDSKDERIRCIVAILNVLPCGTVKRVYNFVQVLLWNSKTLEGVQ